VFIRQVRADQLLENIKFVVGGYAFNDVEGLRSVIGADRLSMDAEGAVQVVNELLRWQFPDQLAFWVIFRHVQLLHA
jgi:hypothetical protein